ncbi:MAG TPA: tetratricopeptide repeat protein, partial [Rhodothermales bacterium]|nr:tetratricopeptide repeat protein [Rhodothermales bacterium]
QPRAHSPARTLPRFVDPSSRSLFLSFPLSLLLSFSPSLFPSSLPMPQDRLALLLQYLEEDPADAFTRFAIAQEYLKRGDLERAVGFFEALVKDQPEYVGTYYHLGKLYEQVGRKPEALDTYRAGLRAAQEQRDFHARAELQDALLKAEGVGFEDDDFE